jgi:hypothetical protein
MNRTSAGITTNLSNESENADESIRTNCEFDSNDIDDNLLQYEKHSEQRNATL